MYSIYFWRVVRVWFAAPVFKDFVFALFWKLIYHVLRDAVAIPAYIYICIYTSMDPPLPVAEFSGMVSSNKAVIFIANMSIVLALFFFLSVSPQSRVGLD